MDKFYNTQIQTSKELCLEIINSSIDKKMLVFGLGYDSELWYNITNFNTFFVEDDIDYINMNTNIPKSHIIYYDYKNINVEKSFQMSDSQIEEYKIPEQLLANGPFDVIFIDGPKGYNNSCSGRLLPIYWSSKFLSKTNTIIYVDDCNRKLEKYCISKYFATKDIFYFNLRDGCSKITF